MRKLGAAVLVLVGALVAAACGSDDDDSGASGAEGRLCARAEACNLLMDQTVEDCTDELRICVGELTSDQRTDWNSQVEGCLALSECADVESCYLTVSYC